MRNENARSRFKCFLPKRKRLLEKLRAGVSPAQAAEVRTASEKVGQVLPFRKFRPTGNTRPPAGELHAPEFVRLYYLCRRFRRGVGCRLLAGRYSVRPLELCVAGCARERDDVADV